MERFDGGLAAAIERAGQVTQMVPTMFVRMLQLPERSDVSRTSSLRLAVHAGAPCHRTSKTRSSTRGERISWRSGSTEGHGVSIITAQEAKTKQVVGKAALGVVHISDDDGAELAAGEVGLVYFERDVAAFSYRDEPEKTADARHPAHGTWSTVGRSGLPRRRGYLYLTDRKAFTIISGGVNIYPQEIENVLTMHPLIFDVAVIGVPDPEMGSRSRRWSSCATVSNRPTSWPPTSSITSATVAHFKARDRSTSSMNCRSATGKLVKRNLQARYVEATA